MVEGDEDVLRQLLRRFGSARPSGTPTMATVVAAIEPEFDRLWYLECHPDVAGSGVDPVWHYVLSGADKGYDPHPGFSTRLYIERYPDVQLSGLNPFFHWVQHSRNAGRIRSAGTAWRRRASAQEGEPRLSHAMFSIFLDCRDKSASSISASLEGFRRQTYRNFELVLLGFSGVTEAEWCAQSARGLFYEPLVNSGDVFSCARRPTFRGDYVLTIEAGDRLNPCALRRLNDNASPGWGAVRADLIVFDYTSDQQGKTCCLPGLDFDLLVHADYLRAACAISTSAMGSLLAKRDYLDLRGIVLAAVQEGAGWRHIPEPLLDSQVRPEIPPFPLGAPDVIVAISVIIPNRNRPDLLEACTRFLYRMKTPFQLIIVDNESTDPEVFALYDKLRDELGAMVLHVDHAFNHSRMVNAGAAAAVHECLLLLGNNIHIDDPHSVAVAAEYAGRPGVGVVGSILRSPAGDVQHAGCVFRVDSTGELRCENVLFQAGDDEGIFLGALSAPRNWQAVSGAFHVVFKSVFEAAGGYDDCNLPVDYGDIDFCFRLRSMGLRVVCLPLRGVVEADSCTGNTLENTIVGDRRKSACTVMSRRWRGNFVLDPFLHSRARHDFVAAESSSLQLPVQRAMPGGGLLRTALIPEALEPRRLKPGICIIGFLNSEIGLGEAARNMGRACDSVRLPLSYVNRPLDGRSNEPVFETMFQSKADRIVSLSVEGLSLDGYNPKDEGEGRFRILYPFWELPHIPEGARAVLAGYDELWAASEFIASTLREAVQKPVRLVPQPLVVPEKCPAMREGAAPFRFLTFFDYDSHIARKNPLAAIAAFRAAFPRRKDVQLLVKARGHGNKAARRKVADAVRNDPRIRIIDATISRQEMRELLRESDAFVSLHRSEGFGFGAAEALSAGRAVIATGWSATSDFVTPETGFVVDYLLKPVGRHDYLYSEKQVWADPLLESAVAQMIAVVDDPSAAYARARRGHALLLARNSLSAVGALVGAALKDLGAL